MEELQLFLKISGAVQERTQAITVPAGATVDEVKSIAFPPAELEPSLNVRMVYQGHLLPGSAALARFSIPSGAFVHCFFSRAAATEARSASESPAEDQSWVTRTAMVATFFVLIAAAHAYLDHPEHFDGFALYSVLALAALWFATLAGYLVACLPGAATPEVPPRESAATEGAADDAPGSPQE
jgi:hypothetical protein